MPCFARICVQITKWSCNLYTCMWLMLLSTKWVCCRIIHACGCHYLFRFSMTNYTTALLLKWRLNYRPLMSHQADLWVLKIATCCAYRVRIPYKILSKFMGKYFSPFCRFRTLWFLWFFLWSLLHFFSLVWWVLVKWMRLGLTFILWLQFPVFEIHWCWPLDT